MKKFPEDTKKIGVDMDILDTEMKWRSHVGEITPDIKNIIFPKGFRAICNEAKEKLLTLQYSNAEDLDKIDYYKASIEACEGIMALGKRYAQHAEAMAIKEQEPIRKKQLETIAANCRRVPEYAPRDFWEAAQMVWFVMLGCYLSENSPGL